ncbi:MAG TPA: hypothetical protein VNL74_01075 [Methylococcus sp.]|nr:hypothetical protein [Methylococcus sp.]
MNEATFTLYHPATGQILQTVVAPPSSMDAYRLSYGVLDGTYNGDTHYVDLSDPENPVVVARPASSIALSGTVLQNVPVAGQLHIDAEVYDLLAGDTQLDLPYPGTYKLRVECWPYLPWEGEVVVP